MKTAIMTTLLSLVGSITFTVDKNLTPPDEEFYLHNGEEIAHSILSEEQILTDYHHIIASSFADEQQLIDVGIDAFYQSIIKAYAHHHSITLSPDMIWLLISQGFARYVNAHSDQLRPLIVSHTGKMELEVKSVHDLLSPEADWAAIISGFSSQIEKNTKHEIAQTIVSDFSTTTATERVASQITLMDMVEDYFDYTVVYALCGIPTVTLKGTPEDWRHVLEKTRALEKYGLGNWTKRLEPILAEFIKAAEGHPNQKFWQDIVKKKRVKQLKNGNCDKKKPTILDGWLLQFFPDENGNTKEKVYKTHHYPSGMLCVNFRYRTIDPTNNTVVSDTPMELWAGFIGAEADKTTNMITPKIGWLVRVAETPYSPLATLR